MQAESNWTVTCQNSRTPFSDPVRSGPGETPRLGSDLVLTPPPQVIRPRVEMLTRVKTFYGEHAVAVVKSIYTRALWKSDF